MAPKALCFLDVDGVLNNSAHLVRLARAGYAGSSAMMPLDPENVQQLKRVLRAVPETRIVVSSSWRYLFSSVEKMRARLAPEGVPVRRIIGLTPSDLDGGERRDVALETGGNSRGHQIRAWLAWNAPDCTRYVIIDDDSDAGFTHDPNKFVKTSNAVGLTKADADRAIVVLSPRRALR